MKVFQETKSQGFQAHKARKKLNPKSLNASGDKLFLGKLVGIEPWLLGTPFPLIVWASMSHTLNSLKGNRGFYRRLLIIGFLKGDPKSLDCSSYRFMGLKVHFISRNPPPLRPGMDVGPSIRKKRYAGPSVGVPVVLASSTSQKLTLPIFWGR